MNDLDIGRELDALKDRIAFTHKGYLVTAAHDIPVFFWKKMFGPISPRAVVDTLSKNVKHTSIELPYDQIDQAILMTRDGDTTAQTYLILDSPLTESKRFKLDDLNVIHGIKGGGIAKKIMSNLLDLVEEHGPHVEKITTSTHSVGAYAAARFGFYPTPDVWTGYLQDTFHPRINDIHHQLTGPELKTCEEVCSSRNPKLIWRLADMNRLIVDPYNDHQETSIGKLILIDNTWTGALHLTDPEAMTRFQNYVGRPQPFAPRTISIEHEEPGLMAKISRSIITAQPACVF